MNYSLLLYELGLLPLLGLALWFAPHDSLKQKRLYIYVLLIATFLTLWGEVAIAMEHWSYPVEFNVGRTILNQPIELYLEAVATTVLIVCFWEFVKNKLKDYK